MIIVCINCNKKFNVDQNLIPENGRQIQCGSCNHIWHYKIKKIAPEPYFIDKEINQIENTINKNKSDDIEINKASSVEVSNDNKTIKKLKKENTIEDKNEYKTFNSVSFFSFLIVFIISIISFVILVDTIKLPLINIFPGLEIILFNLFETLKDVKLFIIDLT